MDCSLSGSSIHGIFQARVLEQIAISFSKLKASVITPHPIHLEKSMATLLERVFLPGESHRQRSLVGYSPWGHEELDTTEVT